MGSRNAVRWITIGALAAFLSAPPAWAQSEADRATARELAYEGQEAFDRGDFATAADRFSRADALVHAPTLTLALARSELRLGKVVRAFENYNRILREGVPPGSPPVFQQARDDAEREVEQARAKLAWVTLQLEGPTEADVMLDENQPVSRAALGIRRAIDPGEHRVRATAAGYLPAESRFELGEGESTEVVLNLERDPNAPVVVPAQPTGGLVAGGQVAPPPVGGERIDRGATQRALGYVALGIGGAGIVVGSVTGVLAVGEHSTLQDECPSGTCPSGQQDTLDRYRTLGGVSTVAFAVGAAGAIAGVTLLLTAPASEPAPRVGLGVRGSGVVLNGVF